MKARVVVTLKEGVLDPQGKAIEGALKALGVEGIRSVRQGKLFEIDVDGDEAATTAVLKAASEKLLANTVIENYVVRVRPGQDGSGMPAKPRRVDPDKATEDAARAAEMPTEGHP